VAAPSVIHDWEDLDRLLTDIDSETEAEARAFEDTGGSGVLTADLLGSDEGPFPGQIQCTFNSDMSPFGEYPAAWRPLTVDDFQDAIGTVTIIMETLHPAFAHSAKAAGEAIRSTYSFIEASGYRFVGSRWMPISEPARRPFPTRKGPRTKKRWHR